MASRLREIEWLRFVYATEGGEPEEWAVLFTTPAIAPKSNEWRAFRNKRHYDIGYCVWPERRIYLDAGLGDDEIGETLQHELWHVPRYGSDIDRDHELIYASSPFSWKTMLSWGMITLPPFPEGFASLRRSSRRYRTRREWE